MTILSAGEELDLGLEVIRDDAFKASKSKARVPKDQIVIHESVTHDYDPVESPEDRDDSTERILKRRGLGVHFMVGIPEADPEASVVVQHNDLTDRLSHAGKLNAGSVAIEVINPYYGKRLKEREPWKLVIRARWAHGKLYIVPTPAQLEATWKLVEALTGVCLPGLEIPRAFPGMSEDGTRIRMGRVPKADTKEGGIWAHHYCAHADGAFPVLYCAIRDRGLPPEEAYNAAVRAAKGVRAGWAKLPV